MSPESTLIPVMKHADLGDALPCDGDAHTGLGDDYARLPESAVDRSDAPLSGSLILGLADFGVRNFILFCCVNVGDKANCSI